MNSKDILEYQKKNLNIFFSNIDHIQLDKIIKNISNLPNYAKIITIGVGKSENIAIHFTSLLNSINIQSCNLSVLNALHGDIGIVNDIDYIIYISNSGNTKEILNIAPYISNRCTNIIGIFSNPNAKLIEFCEEVLIMPKINEIDSFNTIPTSSILEYIICINIIISALITIRNICKNTYSNNHPEGNIGLKCNKKLADIMIIKDKLAIVDINNTIKETLFIICKKRLRCCLVKLNNKFIGLVTDGNIRRYLSNDNSDIHDKIENCINTTPLILNQDVSFNILIDNLKNKHQIISGIPITNNNNKIVGLVTQEEIINNIYV